MLSKTIRYISLLFLVLWMGAIFSFSAQSAPDSGETSRGVLEKVVSAVYPPYDKLDSAEKEVIINRFSFPIRKCAHFFEFAVLGALAFVFFWTFSSIHIKYRVVFSLALGLVYAISDEVHQLFIAGRACRVLDVLIDFAGVLFAVILAFLIPLRFRSDKVG